MLRDSNEKELLGRYSSFTLVENTLRDIVSLLLKNERLKRLLFYSDPKALSLPKLTVQQSMQLPNKYIRIVPRLEIDDDNISYIIITMDNFLPMEGVSSFRGATLGIDIICNYNNWILDDFKLRPYSIAGEIDAMINRSTVGSLKIGEFVGGKSLIISPEVGGFTIYYKVESLKDDLQDHENR